MSRRRSAIALVSLWLLPLACALAACVGDDTNAPLPDAGASNTPDATVGADAAPDASADEGGACTPFDAGALDDASVARGLSLIKQYKCQKCHGQTLTGNNNGVQTSYGTAYPPNLSPDPESGLGCWTKDQVLTAMLHGTDNEGAPICPPMPRFGEIDGGLDRDAAASIADFLRSLTPVPNDVPSTDCSGMGDGGLDAGTDAGGDAGTDASVDGGVAVGTDAGSDAAVDDAAADDAAADASGD
jgi:hypothetical protein